jgi:hypothetical protein
MLLTLLASDNPLPYEVFFGIVALLIVGGILLACGVWVLNRETIPTKKRGWLLIMAAVLLPALGSYWLLNL